MTNSMTRSGQSKVIILLCLLIPILTGCGGGGGTSYPAGQVQKITISSTFLQRNMRLKVYTPPGYSSDQRYPVLYAIHGYGGTEDSWMPNQLSINLFSDNLIADGKIKSIIIVAPEMDNSWGVNSSETPGKSTNRAYDTGMYEDYFIKEVVPYIDAHYSTITSRDGRYIGGISMGGFIALFYGFAHNDMFSKVGGHSPAILYPEDYNGPDYSGHFVIEDFVYPNETLRHERDPYYLAQTKDLSQTQVYLDAGYADSNKIECGLLFNILQARGVPSENHVSPGGHEGSYWGAHIQDYLLFYAGE